jgi:hypothetical protein
MNELIKEFEKQATTIEYGVDNGFDRVTFDKEKFAELIVENCYQQLIYLHQQVEGFHNHYKYAAVQIKRHFGVKE